MCVQEEKETMQDAEDKKQVDTKINIYVGVYVKLMPNPPETFCMCYSPEKVNVVKYMWTVISRMLFGDGSKRDPKEVMFDDLEDAGKTPGQVLVLPEDGEQHLLHVCRTESEDERFVMHHYSELEEDGSRKLLGIFSIDGIGSTVYDFLNRQTNADIALFRNTRDHL